VCAVCRFVPLFWPALDPSGIRGIAEKSKGPRTDRVFRTPYKKLELGCVKTYEKSPGVKLTVWGCFWGPLKDAFIPIVVESFNNVVYRKLLKEYILPVLQHMKETLQMSNFTGQCTSTQSIKYSTFVCRK